MVRRLRRIAFSGLAAVSALLLFALTLLWARSYLIEDVITVDFQAGDPPYSYRFIAGSYRNAVNFYVQHDPMPAAERLPTRWKAEHSGLVAPPIQADWPWEAYGFILRSGRESLDTTLVAIFRPYIDIAAPDWFVAIVLAILPAAWLVRRWRNRPKDKPRRRNRVVGAVIFGAFTCLAVGCALLCVATLSEWIRSYWKTDELDIYTQTPTQPSYACWISLNSYHQAAWLFLQRDRDPHDEGGDTRYEYSSHVNGDLPVASWISKWERWGFRLRWGRSNFDTPDSPTGNPYINLAAPEWLLTILFSIPPIAWLMLWRRRRQIRRGICGSCGYDLRATPGRCPECGSVPVEVSTDMA